MPRVALLELDGNVATQAGGVSASLTTDSLGLNDDEAAFNPRADLDWDPLHVSVETLAVEFQGNGVAQAQIDFGGGTIPIAAPVYSQAELDLTEARIVYDFIPGLIGDLGIGLGVGYLDARFALDEIGGAGQIRLEQDLPYGFLTGRAGRSFGPVEGLVTLSGLSFEFEDDSYSLLDAEGMLIWTFYDTLKIEAELALGYRYINLDFAFNQGGSSADFDLDITGPFFGLFLNV